MHNNAVGPEICGKPQNTGNFFYRSPYVDPQTKQLIADAPGCWAYDPSVEGRYKLFVASAEELLAPEEKRTPKITKFDVDVPLPFELRVVEDGTEKRLHGFTVVIPKGTSAGALGNFQHKAFVNDLVLARLKPDALEARLVKQLGEKDGKEMAAQLRTHRGRDGAGSVQAHRDRAQASEGRRGVQLVPGGHRELRSPFRHRPARRGQEGADRLSRDALEGACR